MVGGLGRAIMSRRQATGSGSEGGTSGVAIVLMIFCTFLLAAVQYLLKLATTRLDGWQQNPLALWPLVVGVVLAGLASLIMTYSFKRGELSVLYPFISLSFIWTAIVATFLFDETLHLSTLAGMAFIIVGVILLGMSTRSKRGGRARGSAAASRSGQGVRFRRPEVGR